MSHFYGWEAFRISFLYLLIQTAFRLPFLTSYVHFTGKFGVLATTVFDYRRTASMARNLLESFAFEGYLVEKATIRFRCNWVAPPRKLPRMDLGSAESGIRNGCFYPITGKHNYFHNQGNIPELWSCRSRKHNARNRIRAEGRFISLVEVEGEDCPSRVGKGSH